MADAGAGLKMRVHAGRLAVVRQPAGTAAPAWAADPGTAALHVIVRSGGETSLLVDEAAVPEALAGGGSDRDAGVGVERGFRALSVTGPLDFALVGILADLAGALAAAEVSIFAVSTFDTDWILVREPKLPAAVAALRAAGVHVDEAADTG